jgi:hypothetical protein
VREADVPATSVYRFPPAQVMDSLSQAPLPAVLVLVIVYTRLRMRRVRPIRLCERDRLAAVGRPELTRAGQWASSARPITRAPSGNAPGLGPA